MRPANHPDGMNHTPAQQWSALSALYEEADGLSVRELQVWLERLEQEGHPLLPQLKLMLEARDQLDADDFLGTLPRLSAEAADTSDWAAGRRVGPYRLVKPLGQGGMAEVWLAERDDGAFKRQVAIKLPYPRPGRETFAVRFDRERDILASLRHPHIAGLFDAGVTKEGQAWLALEYVEGQPISMFCDERKLPVRERVMLFRQVLLAVQHAHANLVIHRDLKPANILVTSQGEVRLLDFGIAKLLEAQGDAIEETELTRQAGRSMTPRYASPEQLTGLPLTTACDVYSLGVIFYELISGERPYELKTESQVGLEHAILEAEPRAPSRRQLSEGLAEARGTTVKRLRSILSPELDAIALRCLAKKPSARFSSVDALLADVDRWLAGETVLARAPGTWYRFRKFALRHKLGVGLSVASIAALASVAAVAVVLGLQAREESARASASRDFMLGLFERANQEKARGADITARELLETGRRDLSSRLAGQPRLQGELLLGIGKIQMEMGEYANADSTFADAARIYAQLEMPREEVFSRVSHADNALRMGNPSLAKSLLDEARKVKNRPLADNELNAYMKAEEGWIASIHGDAMVANSAFAESRKYALAAFGATHPKTIDALRGGIYAQRQLRNYEEALRLQTELEHLLSSVATTLPRDLASLDMDRAELLQYSGRYKEVLQHAIASLPRCVKELGVNDERCRRLLLAKLQAMTRLGLPSEQQADLPQLQALVNDQTSPALQAEALFIALRWYSLLGDSQKLRDLAARVQEFGESGADLQVNPALKVRALMMLAESRLLAGDHRKASHWIKRAFEKLGPGAKGPTAMLFNAVGASLSAIALLQEGQPSRALDESVSAQQKMAVFFGETHALSMIFSLNTAIALEALDRTEEALAIVNRAEPILVASLGRECPILRRLERLKSRLENPPARSTQDGGRLKSPFDTFI